MNTDELIFHCSNGDKYIMYHNLECCESVTIDDICGDLNDLIGSPIILAEEVSNKPFIEEFEKSFEETEDSIFRRNKYWDLYPESYTWTFYKFATRKGYVDIKWYGESNGSYSESVDFVKLD